jgi:SPP1 family predicted phage head-tail adaptor
MIRYNTIKTGDLRHRVVILQKQMHGTDTDGYPTQKWEPLFSIWAAVRPASGREYFQAAAVQAEHQVRFTMRYRKDITVDMRLRYDRHNYEIKAVIDLEGRHRWLEVMGEVVTDG